ncbi:recombinase family protein [Corynebacterium variabile]|uniref:hypothetical protein n=1 Tax=Corynebacterium variabile TaxID=1727 RepID=UPI003C9F82E2
MSTQLATTDPQAALHEKMEWSKAMSTGSLLPQQYRQNPGNLLFAAEYADNLGVGRIHVLTSIAVINGKPSPSADLMAAMVRTHGHKLRVYGDDTQATAELIRSDDPDFTFTAVWDIAKAQKAKLWGNKGPWSQYPAAMLRARAISEVVRMGAQDVMAGGIYTPEELGAVVNADGEVLEQPARATAERVDEHRQDPRLTPAQEPARQSATDRLAAQLGATPAPAHPDPAASLETWQALIAATDTLEDLQQVYHDAYKEVGDAIIPAKDQRKTELQSAATDDKPIDAELVDDAA